MISLVGLGVSCDITIEGLAEAKAADELYLDAYTSYFDEAALAKIREATGKDFITLEREKVEGDFLLSRAAEKKVCLLVGGDPLNATTHITLLHGAAEKGVEARVVHNSSIISSAAGKSGLQPYSFGKTVTLAYWRENYEPTSPLGLVLGNLSLGLHTLVLLDLDKELGPMDAKKGLGLLSRMEEKEGKQLPDDIIVLSRVGYADEKVTYGKRAELAGLDLGKPPFCFAIPGKLHPFEKDYLDMLKERK